jgi:hypothetical protein
MMIAAYLVLWAVETLLGEAGRLTLAADGGREFRGRHTEFGIMRWLIPQAFQDVRDELVVQVMAGST